MSMTNFPTLDWQEWTEMPLNQKLRAVRIAPTIMSGPRYWARMHDLAWDLPCALWAAARSIEFEEAEAELEKDTGFDYTDH